MTNRIRSGATLAAVAISLALWSGGCDVGGAPTDIRLPGDSLSTPAKARTIRATVDASDPSASPGDVVTLEARLSRGRGAPTPTGFVVSLRYDPSCLTPVAHVSDGDGGSDGDGTVLRVVNLHAAEGTVKAAGAAPDGLPTDVLFAVRMRVLKAGWSDGLALDVGELDVLEDGFADVASSVVAAPPGGR